MTLCYEQGFTVTSVEAPKKLRLIFCGLTGWIEGCHLSLGAFSQFDSRCSRPLVTLAVLSNRRNSQLLVARTRCRIFRTALRFAGSLTKRLDHGP